MNYPTWKAGDSGLIYLPDPRTLAGQKNRPYYLLDVDESGRCKIREGPMSWTEANERLVGVALEESVSAFSAPLEKRIEEHRSQGRLARCNLTAQSQPCRHIVHGERLPRKASPVAVLSRR
ncbi:MAG: hypothetical protein AB9873_13440 [Syntrophobacteraceae bacterium]